MLRSASTLSCPLSMSGSEFWEVECGEGGGGGGVEVEDDEFE